MKLDKERNTTGFASMTKPVFCYFHGKNEIIEERMPEKTGTIDCSIPGSGGKGSVYAEHNGAGKDLCP